MSSGQRREPCEFAEAVCAHALRSLPAAEVQRLEAHLATCADCTHELEALRLIVDRFGGLPTDILKPPAAIQLRLARRLAAETGTATPVPPPRWAEPAWEDVAPGISVKILAKDDDRSMVSMLVRLAPGAEYPPHRHAGVEELHLLDGELWIDERKLFPGDYNQAPPGTGDRRVWSETGCTCVLMTSTRDVLG